MIGSEDKQYLRIRRRSAAHAAAATVQRAVVQQRIAAFSRGAVATCQTSPTPRSYLRVLYHSHFLEQEEAEQQTAAEQQLLAAIPGCASVP